MRRKIKMDFVNYLNGGTMGIEEILTKNIQVELSVIRIYLFVIAVALILEFFL